MTYIMDAYLQTWRRRTLFYLLQASTQRFVTGWYNESIILFIIRVVDVMHKYITLSCLHRYFIRIRYLVHTGELSAIQLN